MKTYFFQDTFDLRTGTVVDCHCAPEPGAQRDNQRDPQGAREAWLRRQSLQGWSDAQHVDAVGIPDPDAARAAWLRRQEIQGWSDAQLRQTLTDTLRGTRPVTLNDADPDAARAVWVQRLVSASKALP